MNAITSLRPLEEIILKWESPHGFLVGPFTRRIAVDLPSEEGRSTYAIDNGSVSLIALDSWAEPGKRMELEYDAPTGP